MGSQCVCSLSASRYGRAPLALPTCTARVPRAGSARVTKSAATAQARAPRISAHIE